MLVQLVRINVDFGLLNPNRPIWPNVFLFFTRVGLDGYNIGVGLVGDKIGVGLVGDKIGGVGCCKCNNEKA